MTFAFLATKMTLTTWTFFITRVTLRWVRIGLVFPVILFAMGLFTVTVRLLATVITARRFPAITVTCGRSRTTTIMTTTGIATSAITTTTVMSTTAATVSRLFMCRWRNILFGFVMERCVEIDRFKVLCRFKVIKWNDCRRRLDYSSTVGLNWKFGNRFKGNTAAMTCCKCLSIPGGGVITVPSINWIYRLDSSSAAIRAASP